MASGPSSRTVNLNRLRGAVRVFAVKEGVTLVPWADAVYGCDKAWWEHRGGLKEFAGVRMAWAGGYTAPDVQSVTILLDKYREPFKETFSFGVTGEIGGGRNSGFQALNLAAQFGCKRVYLVGFDMKGQHFYGRNRWPKAANPDPHSMGRWAEIMAKAAPALAARGIEVLNASKDSALTCFRKVDLNAIELDRL